MYAPFRLQITHAWYQHHRLQYTHYAMLFGACQPEDGWMFEARQGCAARECAAQGLIKLASTGATQPSGTLVNPAGNTVSD